MTEEPTPEEMEAVTALLRDPAMWAEPSPDVEERVVAEILHDIAGIDLSDARAARDDVISFTPDVPPARPAARQSPWARSDADRRTGLVPPSERPDRFEPAVTGVVPVAVAPSDAPPHSGDGRRAGPGGQVTDLGTRRSRRRLLLPLAAAAAVVAAAVAALSILDLGSTEVQTVALAGSENAPTASAVAEIEHRDNGDRIVLSVENLPPAPPGSFYAAWVIDDDPALRVGAGTFHLRGGDGEIELWSGVSTETYRTVSVTLQSVDDPDGPGQPILKGTLEPIPPG